MSHCARICGRTARWRITAAGPAGTVDALACDTCLEPERRSAAKFGPPAVEQLANAPPPEPEDIQLDLFPNP